MINFELIVSKLGGIGPAQIIASVLLGLTQLLFGTTGLATVFIAYPATFRCNVPPLDNAEIFANLSEDDILNLTTPFDPTTGKYDTCKRFGYDLTSCNSSLSCVNKSAPAIPCDKGYYYDKSIFTATVITEFDLVCSRSYLNPLSTSMYYVGLLIASFIFGDLVDRYGRKPIMVLTYIAALGSSFGVTYSISVEMYIVFRALVSGFIFGTNTAIFVYAIEIVSPRWRKISGKGSGISFTIGYMILGGLAYQWRNWRDIQLAATILSIPFLFPLFFMPESPRWLFSKNKNEEGKKVVKIMERLNRKTLTTQDWEEVEKYVSAEPENTDLKYSFVDLFKTPRIRVISCKLFFIWLVTNVIYYGVSLNAGSLSGDVFLNNTLNGVFELASIAVVIALIDRVGRRFLQSVFLVLTGVNLIASIIVNEYAGDNQSLITLGVVFAYFAKFGISGAFNVLYTFTVELYPTLLRSTGFGNSSVCGRIGAIIAPYALELQNVFKWLPYAIFGVFETKGQPMMENVNQAEAFYNGNIAEQQNAFYQKSFVGEKKLPLPRDNAYNNIRNEQDEHSNTSTQF